MAWNRNKTNKKIESKWFWLKLRTGEFSSISCSSIDWISGLYSAIESCQRHIDKVRIRFTMYYVCLHISKMHTHTHTKSIPLRMVEEWCYSCHNKWHGHSAAFHIKTPNKSVIRCFSVRRFWCSCYYYRCVYSRSRVGSFLLPFHIVGNVFVWQKSHSQNCSAPIFCCCSRRCLF